MTGSLGTWIIMTMTLNNYRRSTDVVTCPPFGDHQGVGIQPGTLYENRPLSGP